MGDAGRLPRNPQSPNWSGRLRTQKFKPTPEDQQELLADYLPHCTTVPIPRKAPRVPACRDALDRPFLELAVVGSADYLVTGDKDLLNLARTFEYPIVTPEHFLELLQAT